MIEHHHPMIWHAGYFCLSSSLIASSNIDFDASHRDIPLSTFCRTTRKYISFSCRVNLLHFFMPPLHPSSTCCTPNSSLFSACSSFSLPSSSDLTASLSSPELTALYFLSLPDSLSSSSQDDLFGVLEESSLSCSLSLVVEECSLSSSCSVCSHHQSLLLE